MRRKRSPVLAARQAVVTMLLLVGCGGSMARPVSEGDGGEAARMFLVKGQKPPARYGAYGYILFTKKKGASREERHALFCKGYVENLEPTSELGDVPEKDIMPTIWLLKKSIGYEDRDDCAAMLASYDYRSARKIARSISKQDSEGPVLVAWSRPYGPDSDTQDAFVMDLAYVPTDAFEVDRAFDIWMKYIVQDPDVWQRLDALLTVEEIRGFLQKYGDGFIGTIKNVKDLLR